VIEGVMNTRVALNYGYSNQTLLVLARYSTYMSKGCSSIYPFRDTIILGHRLKWLLDYAPACLNIV
jgi:hypothetical protein